jgi:hypothetical protein
MAFYGILLETICYAIREKETEKKQAARKEGES